MKQLAIIAGASLFAAPAFADWSRPLDRGGKIGDTLMQIMATSGQRHEIRGDCMSSCTMWLGHRGTCVTREAKLWFHAAQDGRASMRYGNPWRTISAEGNATLLAFYPPRVREVVRPWLQSPEYRTLTGAQLIALGVPECRR